MNPVRVLHVDDEPDIREVVEMSLSLDPGFTVRSCASGQEALVEAADWSPHAILCDVMMPVMDGPATLARLRGCAQTEKIPVIFMTARAQNREIEHFKALGAAGVICKPFDPMTLPSEIRRQLCAAGIAALSANFAQRLHSNAAELARLRSRLRNDAHDTLALDQIKTIAHSLAGAAGVYGCDRIGNEAAMLEDAAIKRLTGAERSEALERGLDNLLTCLANA
jgi:two-component system OmpR family response regulator